MTITIKSWDGTQMILEGPAVLFSSVDLQGEYFTKDTDFWESSRPAHIPILWNHGMGDVGKRILGVVENLRRTSAGLIATMKLDNLTPQIAAKIAAWIEKRELGLSSGSVSHLVERAGSKITSWPIVEISLTTDPAEPATMHGLSRIKAVKALSHQLDKIERGRAMDDAEDRWARLTGKASHAAMLELELLELESQIADEDWQRSLDSEARTVKRSRLEKDYQILGRRLDRLEQRFHAR